MKKEYATPKMEKIEFDYTDVVTASGPDSSDAAAYNNDPNGQYFKCSNTGYYAPGWGKNCG